MGMFAFMAGEEKNNATGIVNTPIILRGIE